jgi:hypothetical protein
MALNLFLGFLLHPRLQLSHHPTHRLTQSLDLVSSRVLDSVGLMPVEPGSGGLGGCRIVLGFDESF